MLEWPQARPKRSDAARAPASADVSEFSYSGLARNITYAVHNLLIHQLLSINSATHSATKPELAFVFCVNPELQFVHILLSNYYIHQTEHSDESTNVRTSSS